MPPKKKAISEAQQKVESEAITVSDKETVILFPEQEDMIFMGQNIFGHDFIHDFNTVSMGERLQRIQSNIQALVSFRAGATETGIYTGGDADTEEVDLDNYMLNIPELEKFNAYSNIIRQFNQRRNTRSKVNLLQDIESLVQELKLYYIGYVHSTDAYVEADEDELSIITGGATAAANAPKKMSVNQFKFFSDSLRNAFHKVINIPEHKMLRDVYITMFKLYLFLETPAIHPYKTFNNTCIDKAMLVYLMDPKSFNSGKSLYQLLHTIVFVNSKKAHQKTKKRGSSNNSTGRNSSRRNQGGMNGGQGVYQRDTFAKYNCKHGKPHRTGILFTRFYACRKPRKPK